MASGLKNIDPQGAAKLVEKGALLVDVREPGEYARMHIEGSRHVPLSGFANADLGLEPGQKVVFLCASGNRTSVYGGALAAKANGSEAYQMVGGIIAWSRAGLPVRSGGGAGGGFLSRLFGG